MKGKWRAYCLALSASLLAAPTALAAPKPTQPVPPNALALEVRAVDDAECARWRDFQRESFLPAAVVAAILPKVVDAGLSSLSAALRAASGVDNKTAQSTALTTTSAYDYDTASGARSWSAGNGCLVASTPNGDFRALLVMRTSPDKTALQLMLAELTYKGALRKGRPIEGMTMSVIFKGTDGKELAKATFAGPFVPAPQAYEASADQPFLTSGWMPLPPASEPVKAQVSRYDQLCATRKDAANAFEAKAAEAAKAAKKPAPPASKVTTANGFPCGGVKVQDGLLATPAWPQASEDHLTALDGLLRLQEPISIELVVTETRNVSQFLLQVSEVLSKSKEGVTAAIVERYDEDKQIAAAKADDALAQDYDLELARFQEKVRLYRQAIQAQDAAEAKLAQAQAGGDSDAIEKAAAAAETARVARASAFEAALSARKTARAAALAADISIGPGHSLSTFPD